MSDGVEEEEDRAESLVSGCLSMKSDQSKDDFLFFSNEPGLSDTKVQFRQRAESPAPSCLSMKSDRSKGRPPDLSNEPGPSDTNFQKSLMELFPSDSGVQIIAEPGRYFVESAFTLAANVFARRVISDDVEEHSDGEENNPGRTMMYYINDGAYGSLSCFINYDARTKVEPYLYRAVESSEQRYRSTIWGPTCDSIDKVTDDYWIPECHVGDWLLVDNMGAYSVSMSTDFNGFERAHIYLVVTAETWHALNLSHTYNIIQ